MEGGGWRAEGGGREGWEAMEDVWTTAWTDKERDKSAGPGVGADSKRRSLSLECVRGGGLRGGRRASFASDEGHVLTGAGPFFIFKSKQAVCGGLGVMGKEETVMLIRLLHTSPSDNKTKQEWKHGKKKTY